MLEPATPAKEIRVCIVQQIVPHYRVPVFDLLARQPNVTLSVWSGHRAQGSLKAAPGTGAYKEMDAPARAIGPINWQPAQVTAAKRTGADRFDVIIYSWNARLIHLSRALRIARRNGIATFLWGHGYSKDESPRRRALRNRLLKLSDGCILYNHAAAQRLIDEGVPRERVFVALNAIDQTPIQTAGEHWRARPEDLARFRREHGLRESSHDLILFISRLEPDKHIDRLIDAFSIMAKENPHAKLALIGRGTMENQLRQRVRELSLQDRVIFAGSVYDDMDLAPWFLSSACMAYPAAIGLSVLHAFGYGVPVVTTDDLPSHNPEIEAVRDHHNGLLYRDGDIDDFAAKIGRCLDDQSLRARLGDAAIETIRAPDGFCIERMVRGFTDAIAYARQTPKH